MITQIQEATNARSTIDLAPERAAKTFASMLSGRPVSPRQRETEFPFDSWKLLEVCRNCNKIIIGFVGHGQIKVYNSSDLTCELVLPYYNKPSKVCCFQCTCTEIIAGYAHGSICAWDVKDGTLKQKTSVQSTGADGFACDMRWQYPKLVLATSKKRVQIWQYINASFTLLGSWNTTSPVRGIEFDHNYVILKELQYHEDPCTPYFTIGVYRTDGYQEHTIDTMGNTYVRSLFLAYQNERIIAGSDERNIRIWDVHTGECLWALGGHDFRITCVRVQRNVICSADMSNTVIVWDMANVFGTNKNEQGQGSTSTLNVLPSSRKLEIPERQHETLGFGRNFIVGLNDLDRFRVIEFT